MRKSLAAAVDRCLSVAVSACATKGFVREEVGGVNSKVDTLGGTVEQTQERVGQQRGAHRRGRSEGRGGRQVGGGSPQRRG